MLVEFGRSMSRFLKYIGLTGGGVDVAASPWWTRCCNASVCRRCDRLTVQRVVCGWMAALLEHVVVHDGVGSLVA